MFKLIFSTTLKRSKLAHDADPCGNWEDQYHKTLVDIQLSDLPEELLQAIDEYIKLHADPTMLDVSKYPGRVPIKVFTGSWLLMASCGVFPMVIKTNTEELPQP